MRRMICSLLATLAACTADGAGISDDAPDAGGVVDVDARTDRPLVYGGDRPVDLQIPPTLEPGVSYPLVLILHGFTATGSLQQSYLQLTNLAADPGAFVLAPDGTTNSNGQRFWNASAACCDFEGSGVDDVAYLGGLIDAVSADWPVDRVYVVGHSNGAFMAYRMACERADVITAIAGLAGAAGAPDDYPCDPASPVSSLHIHGTADTVIAYGGGTNGNASYPGALASIEQWAVRNGCATSRTAAGTLDLDSGLLGAETTVENVDECPDGIAMTLWTIQGGSHVPSFQSGFPTTLVDWLWARDR
jgi:polyhydroxybutyrate depolymerase